MKNVNDSSAVAYASVPTQHNYNGGVFPEIVVNNEGCTTVEETVAFVKANQSELEAKLAKSGALLFRGFPIVKHYETHTTVFLVYLKHFLG